MSLTRNCSRFLISLAILLGYSFLPATANAQSVVVSGHIAQAYGSPLPGGTGANGYRVCFRLTLGGTNQSVTNARIVGGGGTMPLVSNENCITPDSSGFYSTSLIANDQVETLGSAGGTQWQVSFMKGGSFLAGSTYYFALADGVENLDVKTPNVVAPIVPAPTGDTTYIRRDGLNAPVTGAISWNALQTFVAGIVSGGAINAGTNPISCGAISASSVTSSGTVTGSNIPASIPGTGTCTNQFVRSLNAVSVPTCNTVGSSDLAASLNLVTPAIGAATGTSLNLGATGVLSTTAQSGTGRFA